MLRKTIKAISDKILAHLGDYLRRTVLTFIPGCRLRKSGSHNLRKMCVVLRLIKYRQEHV